MSGTGNDFQNGAPFYLDATQQDLLLAALASNNQNPNDLFSDMSGLDSKQGFGNDQFQYPANNLDSSTFFSPQQSTPANAFSNFGVEESPFIDYLDGDTTLNFDGDDNGARMIGSLPGDSPEGDSSEKRKSPDEDDDEEEEGGGKRREGDDKQAKKPGRKPLTSEPTTVRLSGRNPKTATNSCLEAESSESGGPTSFQREEGEAPERPGDKGSGA